ncbi:Heterokaryon incompatibility protein 6, OR allele, partial [Madurella mycetomatis]
MAGLRPHSCGHCDKLIFNAADLIFKWDKPVIRVKGVAVLEGALDGCELLKEHITSELLQEAAIFRRDGRDLLDLGVPVLDICFEPHGGNAVDITGVDINTPHSSSFWSVHAEANDPAAAFVSTRPVNRDLQQFTKLPFQPKRLIDTTQAHQGIIRLLSRTVQSSVLTGDMIYAALSYCWGQGKTQPGRTTTANVRYISFDLSTQPKTIQDAVEVTRKLGICRLWIDSLCIIQDDEDDKASQIGEMHKIYASSILTISAARAGDSDEGFLSRCWPASRAVRLRYQTPNQLAGSVVLSKYFGQNSEPIHKRAWTLQEHLLSVRLLIFSVHGLRWSCRTEKKHNGSQFVPDFARNIAEQLSKRGKIPSAQQLATGFRDWVTWHEIVAEFRRRALTFPGDRLPALAAIAAKYSEAVNGQYLAGLWEPTIHRDLLWAVYATDDEVSIRDQHAHFPTWSWASVSGTIDWGFMPHKRYPSTITLLQSDVVPANALAPFGQVSMGALH